MAGIFVYQFIMTIFTHLQIPCNDSGRCDDHNFEHSTLFFFITSNEVSSSSTVHVPACSGMFRVPGFIDNIYNIY